MIVLFLIIRLGKLAFETNSFLFSTAEGYLKYTQNLLIFHNLSRISVIQSSIPESGWHSPTLGFIFLFKIYSMVHSPSFCFKCRVRNCTSERLQPSNPYLYSANLAELLLRKTNLLSKNKTEMTKNY